MKSLNKAFIAAFAFIGSLALISAAFAGARWHFYTAGLCATAVLVGIADLRKSERRKRKR